MLSGLSASIFEEVSRIVSSVLREPVAIAPTSVAEDFARWDSHATVEIIFAVEDHYGFQMTSEQMEHVAGMSSLLEIVASYVGAVGPLL